MNARIERLRRSSIEAQPSISIERALLITEFCRENLGKVTTPVLRAMAFAHLCDKKSIFIGEDELIVGERGPSPKSVPTFPELTCHSAEDLRILDNRTMTRYRIDETDIQTYVSQVIPFWQGRSMRERLFELVPQSWKKAYSAGLFTEFMEQRAPGHTALAGNPTVVIKTNKGTIEAVLYKDKAPISVDNFLKYANAKFFDKTIFHRVIPNFMIQGGGFDQKFSKKETRAAIKNEANNGLKNDRGTLAMARTSVVDSATAQFFINLKANTFLNHGARDFGYAVFGKVTTGMDVVKAIEATPTTAKAPLSKDVPVETVVIESVRIK